MHEPIDVVADACALIGDEPPATLDADAPGGDAAGRLYRTTIGFMLGVYPFSFGQRLFRLARIDGPAPETGHLYAYQLPPERLGAPLRLSPSGTDPDAVLQDFALVGDRVATDTSDVYAAVPILPHPSAWSSSFREAATTALAAKLALARAADRNTYATLWQAAFGPEAMALRGGLMGGAIREDARATPARRIPEGGDPLTRAWRS